MIRMGGAAFWTAVLVGLSPSLVLAQDDNTGGSITVRPADAAPLGDVAESPTSRQALSGPRSTVIQQGTRFGPGYYRGIVPGKNHTPPRARRLKRTRRNFVTWPGFQISGAGSRIFVQSTHPVSYTRADEANRIVLVIPNTRIHLRNNRNPLVTEHFNTPVAEAYLRHRRRDTLLYIEMKVGATPRIHQESQGNYHFLFVEFQAGNYPIPETIRRGYRLSETARSRGNRKAPAKPLK